MSVQKKTRRKRVTKPAIAKELSLKQTARRLASDRHLMASINSALRDIRARRTVPLQTLQEAVERATARLSSQKQAAVGD